MSAKEVTNLSFKFELEIPKSSYSSSKTGGILLHSYNSHILLAND